MYYFIINPASGSGRGLAIWKTIQDELNRLSVDYRAYLLSRPGEAKQLASGFAEKKNPCTVVAVGGDGTINDVISGLGTFSHITFACIPTGSGNDFVRGLGLIKDPVSALHAILSPTEIRKINIGTTLITQEDKFSEYSYAVSSGIGFDAAVCDSVQHSTLKKALNLFHAGKVVYLISALYLLMTMKRGSLKVTLEDGTETDYEKAYFAAVMNLPYEGGGFYFCPDARPDDDCIDLIIVNRISRLRALSLLPQALFGKHVGKGGITIVRCRQAKLQHSDPSCVHTDGEVVGYYKEVTFGLKNEKLAVIVR